MPNTKHILFPFDFSGQSSLAVPYVRAMARRFNSKVTLISVVPPVWTPPTPGDGADIPFDTTQLQDDLKVRLEGALTEDLAGLNVERVVRAGDPAVEIVDFAHSNAADLIMMPTHGYSTFRGLLMGSVAARVLHDAHCPVWTATHARTQDSPDLPNSILCAIDSTPRSVALMQWAQRFACELGATLRLLHVMPPVSDWISLPGERDLERSALEEAGAGVDELRKAAGVRAALRVAVGDVAETVTDEAREESADMLIIGRGVIPSVLGRLRTHAFAIIHRSPCPVISV